MIVLRDKLFMLGTYERGADGKLKRTGTIANGSGVSLTAGIKGQKINSGNVDTVKDNLIAKTQAKNQKAEDFYNKSNKKRTDNGLGSSIGNTFKAFMGGFQKNGLEGGLKAMSGKGGGKFGKGLATVASLGKAAWDMKQQLSQQQEDPGMGGEGYGYGYGYPQRPPMMYPTQPQIYGNGYGNQFTPYGSDYYYY